MEPRSVPGRRLNRLDGSSRAVRWLLSESVGEASMFSLGGAFLQSRAKAVTNRMVGATVERVP